MPRSYAKANLILDLGERDASGRFSTHFIMEEVNLFDDIEVQSIDDPEIVLSCSNPAIPTDERNSCIIAAKRLGELAGERKGARIHIEKRIPAAGGFGGGSSNAACVAMELNKLWGLGLNRQELADRLNPVLGTDTCFFLFGGTAVVEENGLLVTPIQSAVSLAYVFVVPDLEVPEAKTAAIYQHFDPEKVKNHPDLLQMRAKLETGAPSDIAACLFNAFEASPPPFYQKIFSVKDDLKRAGCLNAILCGAGPTVFGICEDEETAKKAAEALCLQYENVFMGRSRELKR